MITFLRKIRKSLVESDSTHRYILFAVGEIALVMIGILLALQVNNWNQERIERRTENVLLEQLQKDLKMSLSDVNLNILFHENAMQSAKLLLAHMASELPYHDSLAFHFASSFPWTRLVINSVAYETIKSHGIEIISNIELRNQFVNLFDGQLYFLRELENITQDYAETMRRVELAKYFKSAFVDFNYLDPTDLGKSVPRDYNSLRKNEEFRYHLETFMHLSRELQIMGNIPTKKKIEELIDAIDKELHKIKL